MTAYTIATLVTDAELYAGMRASFATKGFTADDCDFIEIDNKPGNGHVQTDAYRGLNGVLNKARSEHVILCHQDVVLTHDGRAELDARLAELQSQDPLWAVAGNAGATRPGVIARHITDKHGRNQCVGAFPARVMSLDENFIIVRKSSRIGFSPTLSGFHLYGTDICLAADVMGYSAYVIDFHLTHLGRGKKGPDFAACEKAFLEKWSRALRERKLQTPSTYILLNGGSPDSPWRWFRQKGHMRMRRLKSSILKRLPRNRAKRFVSTHPNPQR